MRSIMTLLNVILASIGLLNLFLLFAVGSIIGYLYSNHMQWMAFQASSQITADHPEFMAEDGTPLHNDLLTVTFINPPEDGFIPEEEVED